MSELAIIFDCRTVVSVRCLFRRKETAETLYLSFKCYGCSPRMHTIVFIFVYAFISGLGLRNYIGFILASSTRSKIIISVVKAITVTVVDLFTRTTDNLTMHEYHSQLCI